MKKNSVKTSLDLSLTERFIKTKEKVRKEIIMYKIILCAITMVMAFCPSAYGLEFSPPVVVNQGVGGSGSQPWLDTDLYGNIYVVWTVWANGGNVYLGMSSDNGSTWTSPSIQVSDTTSSCGWLNPCVQVGSDSVLYVTRSFGVGFDKEIFCSVSSNSGANWDHYQVTGESSYPYNLMKVMNTLIIDDDGVLYCAWHEDGGGLYFQAPHFAKSYDGGETWVPVPNVRMTSAPIDFYCGCPPLAIDGNGILYSMLAAAIGPTWDTYFTKSINGGFSWQVCQNITQDVGSQHNADIACDPDGNLYAVWDSYDQLCIHFSSSTDGGASWSDTLRIGNHQYQEFANPRIEVDDRGNIYVAWVNSSRAYFTMSYDGGETWTDPPVCVNDTIGVGGTQCGPPVSLCVGPGNNIYVVWTDDSNIYFATSTIPVLVSVPDTTYGAAGDTVIIPVNTRDLTGFGVLSAEFDLTYDSDILTGIDVDTSGTLLSGTDWSVDYNVVGNTFSVALAGTDTLAGSGTLINLIFVVSSDAQVGQESPLHFEDFMFNQGDPPFVTTQDGVFIVRDIFGAIEGTVIDAATGSPIAGAIVTAHSTHTCCDTTEADGHYFMEVFPDTYNITVTAIGYNQLDATGIIILPGETTELNFALLHPEIAVEPATIDVTLYTGTLDTLLYITNDGNGPLEFNIEVVSDGVNAALHRETSSAEGRVQSKPGPGSFCRIPADWVSDPSSSRYEGEIIESHPSIGEPSGFEWDGTYFWQGNWNGLVVKFDSNFNFIANYTACGDPSTAPTGLAWHNGYLYQGCYTENNVYKIDVSDGYIPVDIIYTPCTGGLLGVEWVGEHLWVTDDNGDNIGHIYECDSQGNMINSWTSPDLVPFGLSYNSYLDIIYLNGWTGGNIFTIDRYTGDINFAFPTPGTGGSHSCNGGSFDDRYPFYLWIAHQVDYMLYLTDTGNEWISVAPTSGTVAPGETFADTVHFIASPYPTTFTATIVIHNNSVDSLVNIPVSMHVPGATIEGTVTEAENGPIEGAIVTAYSWVDTTDESGYYCLELSPGIYDVIATAFGYNPDTVFAVEVVTTTQVDFALTHPEIVVVPGNLDVTLYLDSILDTLLYITNNGNGPLEFNIEIVSGGQNAALYRINSHDEGSVQSKSGSASFCRPPDDWVSNPAASLYPGEIIESHPSVGEPSGFEWDGTYFWQSNWDNYVVKLDSDFNVIAQYTACGGPGSPPVPATGLAWHNGYLYQGCYWESNVYKIDVSNGYNPVGTIQVPGTGLLGVEWVGDHLWVTEDCWPEHIYECDSLGNMINSWPAPDEVPFGMSYNPYLDIIYINGNAAGNIYTIDPHTGEINFAFPTPGSPGLYSCVGSSFDPRYPSYLWIAHLSDAMLYLTDTGNEVTPWLSVNPLSATVPAGQSLDVIVQFDTYVYGLTPDSTYTTNILIHNNSADSPVTIPVTLHVITVGVEDDTPQVPKIFALSQNYPNPFSASGVKSGNPQTTISYSLPKSCNVSLKIYNIKGQLVETLVNDELQPGYYSVVWNSEDACPGIYLYRITAGDFTDTKKCVILK